MVGHRPIMDKLKKLQIRLHPLLILCTENKETHHKSLVNERN